MTHLSVQSVNIAGIYRMDMGVDLDMLIMPCVDDITDMTDREEVLCAGGRGQTEDRRVPRLPHTAMLQRIHQTNVV